MLALEERIGNVSTGLTEETIKNRLKQQKYSISLGSQQEQEPCCICQVMTCYILVDSGFREFVMK